MSTANADVPGIPDTVLELSLRDLRCYIASDDDDLVIVLEETTPSDDDHAITLEVGIGGAFQDAIDGAEALADTAGRYAELLRTKAQQARQPGRRSA